MATTVGTAIGTATTTVSEFTGSSTRFIVVDAIALFSAATTVGAVNRYKKTRATFYREKADKIKDNPRE